MFSSAVGRSLRNLRGTALEGISQISEVGVGGITASGLGGLCATWVRTATKKAVGKSKNGRDSRPKYLGPKKGNGQWVEPGHIIIRQKGKKWHNGNNVGLGKDFTIWALIPGHVVYAREPHDRKWNNRTKTYVHVRPAEGWVPDPKTLSRLVK